MCRISFFLPRRNKKASSTFPFPVCPLIFPGFCPFLCLPKENFPWRIWERFYFIRFDNNIKDEGSGCVLIREKGVGPRRGGNSGGQCRVRLATSGDHQAFWASPDGSAVGSTLRSDGPSPSPRIWFRTARWEPNSSPDYPRLQRRPPGPNRRLRRPGWSADPAVTCAFLPPAGSVSARRSSTNPLPAFTLRFPVSPQRPRAASAAS